MEQNAGFNVVTCNYVQADKIFFVKMVDSVASYPFFGFQKPRRPPGQPGPARDRANRGPSTKIPRPVGAGF